MSEENNQTEQLNGSADDAIHLPPSLFVQHLSTYPAVSALTGLVASFPVLGQFASNAIPLLKAIHERSRTVADPVVKRASPVIARVDRFGDNLLTSVDHTFPTLQTAQPQEVIGFATRPVVEARERITTYSTTTRGVVEHRIIAPLKAVTRAARVQYSRVYDTNGKALIRSRLDPVVLPINDRLESIIIDYLPEGEEFPQADNLSNELSRTWRLGRVAIRRAIPVITEQANQVATLPQVARDHVRQTYQEKVEKHSTNGAANATTYALAYIGTTRQLSSESLHFLGPFTGVSLFSRGTATTNGSANNDASSDITINGGGQAHTSVISRATNLFYRFLPLGSEVDGPVAADDIATTKIQSQPEPTTTVQQISVEGEIH